MLTTSVDNPNGIYLVWSKSVMEVLEKGMKYIQS